MKGSRKIEDIKMIYAGTCSLMGVHLPIVHVWTLIGTYIS